MMAASLLLAFRAAAAATQGPCDILVAAGNPCVAAHSTTRALYAKYDGPLYNVSRPDGTWKSIGLLSAGGFADKKAHDAFCAQGDCVISNVYDQSPMKNHLGQRHKLINASRHPITIGPAKTPVYGMWFDPGFGMHVDNTTGIATGNDPESIYAVMSGKNFNGRCCFDYGNSETNDRDDGCGTMEAIYFGNAHWRGNTGVGTGPWAGADLEQGMYYGGGAKTKVNNGSLPLTYDFVSLALKGRTDGFDLKGGDATEGKQTTMYSGPRPDRTIAGTCGGGRGSGASITLQKCSAGATNQTWGFLSNGKSIASGSKCLDISNFGTRQGNKIWAWPCGHGSKKNEDWAVKGATIPSLQPNTPFCVGAAGTSVGAATKLDSCTAPSASFTIGFTKAAGSKGTIVQKSSGLCLTVSTGDAPSGLPGYQPMKKKGAIILATGGDNSNGAQGCFYEGIMATGIASEATDEAIQANIVATQYSGFAIPPDL